MTKTMMRPLLHMRIMLHMGSMNAQLQPSEIAVSYDSPGIQTPNSSKDP